MRTSWIIIAVIVMAIVSVGGYFYATSVNVAVHVTPPETSKPPAAARGDTFGKTERQLVFPEQQQTATDKSKK